MKSRASRPARSGENRAKSARGTARQIEHTTLGLQRTVGNRTVSESVGCALREEGRVLDPATRHTMEQRFGVGFGDVRVHNGESAAAAANRVAARAFTAGARTTLPGT